MHVFGLPKEVGLQAQEYTVGSSHTLLLGWLPLPPCPLLKVLLTSNPLKLLPLAANFLKVEFILWTKLSSQKSKAPAASGPPQKFFSRNRSRDGGLEVSLQIHLTLMRVEELVRLLRVTKSSPFSMAKKAMGTAMRSQLRRGKTMPQSFESWLGVNLIEPEVYHEASEAYSYLTLVSPISVQPRPAIIAVRILQMLFPWTWFPMPCLLFSVKESSMLCFILHSEAALDSSLLVSNTLSHKILIADMETLRLCEAATIFRQGLCRPAWAGTTRILSPHSLPWVRL